MMEYGIGAAVIVVLMVGWWIAHRPPVPSQLEPMSLRWRQDKQLFRKTLER